MMAIIVWRSTCPLIKVGHIYTNLSDGADKNHAAVEEKVKWPPL